jgi:hypothetical protein
VRSCKRCCRGKAVNITCYKCVSVGFRYPACKAHAPYCIVICSLSGSTIIFHIGPIWYMERFLEKNKVNTKCVLWVSIQLLYETFRILRSFQGDVITNLHRSSCKVPVILVRLQWNLNLLDIYSKNTQILNFMKICPVGTELFHADGRTDMMKLSVAFRNLQTRLESRLSGMYW